MTQTPLTLPKISPAALAYIQTTGRRIAPRSFFLMERAATLFFASPPASAPTSVKVLCRIGASPIIVEIEADLFLQLREFALPGWKNLEEGSGVWLGPLAVSILLDELANVIGAQLEFNSFVTETQEAGDTSAPASENANNKPPNANAFPPLEARIHVETMATYLIRLRPQDKTSATQLAHLLANFPVERTTPRRLPVICRTHLGASELSFGELKSVTAQSFIQIKEGPIFRGLINLLIAETPCFEGHFIENGIEITKKLSGEPMFDQFSKFPPSSFDAPTTSIAPAKPGTDTLPPSSPAAADEREDNAAIAKIPIQLTFDIGDLNVPLEDFASLKEGYVFKLDRGLEAPVTIRANGCKVGTGDLFNVNGAIGVRIASWTKMD